MTSCRDLRGFAPVEKKLLISGMLVAQISFVIIVSHADIMDCENHHAIKGKFGLLASG